MKVLVIFATTEGHTEKVARFAVSKLKELGHAVSLQDASNSLSGLRPEDFDKAILAGSVHQDQHQEVLGWYIAAHKAALAAMDTLLLSVSLSAAFEGTRDDAEGYVKALCEGLEWRPSRYLLVAGAIKHDSYGYYQEMILEHRVLPRRPVENPGEDHEFTDWSAVEKAVADFVA